MRAFIDTSTLFKKYVNESGSEEFDQLLESISEIILSPVTVLEVNSIIERRLRDKTIEKQDALWIEKEFTYDLNYFGIIKFEDKLLQMSIRVIRRYQLKVLDGIQLASAIISKPDIVLISDRKLYTAAKEELPDVRIEKI
ncbi:MAG: type II toxin-antitoxin system VapC family toxin [Fibrobacterota bacterium]|nr:type II toxin-antitoxin system VapC family toxin [Chitinispirillaceae bacterium]